MRAGRFAALVLAITAIAAAPAASQDLAEVRPVFRLVPDGPEALALTVCVPDGWALYAPDLPEHPTGGAGLPLRIRAGNDSVLPRAWPRPLSRSTVLGRSWIHPAGCFRAGLPAVGPEALAAGLELSWALCRADLCIPGRTVVELESS